VIDGWPQVRMILIFTDEVKPRRRSYPG